jgi:hypothetical protein
MRLQQQRQLLTVGKKKRINNTQFPKEKLETDFTTPEQQQQQEKGRLQNWVQEMLLASRKDAWRSSCCWIFGVQDRSIKREPSSSSVVYLPLLFFDPVPLASP